MSEHSARSRPVTADQCRGCPFPDQTAALELVRLREGLGRLASEWEAVYAKYANVGGDIPRIVLYRAHANSLRALLDDNEGEA